MVVRISRLTIWLYLLMTLPTCVPAVPSSIPPTAIPMKARSGPVMLDGTSWILFAYEGSHLIEGSSFTLKFDADYLTGNSGCNDFIAAYTIEKGLIRVEGIGMRDMACLEPEGVVEQEQYLLECLSKVEAFEYSDDELHLYREDGGSLRFKSIPG